MVTKVGSGFPDKLFGTLEIEVTCSLQGRCRRYLRDKEDIASASRQCSMLGGGIEGAALRLFVVGKRDEEIFVELPLPLF